MKQRNISAYIQDSNEIPKATPTFSGVRQHGRTNLNALRFEVSGKPMMAALYSLATTYCRDQ